MHECLKWILEDFHPLFSCPPPPPSLLLSDYIMIFLSIKIQMHNLNIWQQQPQTEKVCVQQLTEGCFWWARFAKLTLWKKKVKQNNRKKKRKTQNKNVTFVKFNGTTSNMWHRNILADIKYSARLPWGCGRWKHFAVRANTCLSVAVYPISFQLDDFITAAHS